MAIISICGLIAVGAVSILLAEEFRAWMPWLIERLIRRAVRALPMDKRERYGEEWRSHLNEIPGEFGRLIVAIGCAKAANKIRHNLRSPLPKKRLFSNVRWQIVFRRGNLFVGIFAATAVTGSEFLFSINGDFRNHPVVLFIFFIAMIPLSCLMCHGLDRLFLRILSTHLALRWPIACSFRRFLQTELGLPKDR
jgi:hypothetical protein